MPFDGISFGCLHSGVLVSCWPFGACLVLSMFEVQVSPDLQWCFPFVALFVEGGTLKPDYLSPTACSALFCSTPQLSQNLVEPSWHPRGTCGTLLQDRPGPLRSLSGLTPQSFQLLGKKVCVCVVFFPWKSNGGSWRFLEVVHPEFR